MPKKQAQAAQSATNTANTTAGNYGTGAATVGSTLVPELTKEATNPTGLTPTERNNELVAGEQGAGGATAGITGQANLEAARTHNTGALSGVLDEAARAKTRQLSTNALNIENQNTALKESQRQAGLKGLEGTYGTDVGAQLKAEGLVPEDITAWNKAPTALGEVEGGLNTLANVASAGAGVKKAFG